MAIESGFTYLKGYAPAARPCLRILRVCAMPCVRLLDPLQPCSGVRGLVFRLCSLGLFGLGWSGLALLSFVLCFPFCSTSFRVARVFSVLFSFALVLSVFFGFRRFCLVPCGVVRFCLVLRGTHLFCLVSFSISLSFSFRLFFFFVSVSLLNKTRLRLI